MDDAELKNWLRGVFLASIKGLKLPRWAEEAVMRCLNLVPVGLLLAWTAKLGLASENEIRQIAGTVPDLAARLNTDEGREAIRAWEGKHRIIPLLRAVRGVVKRVSRLWQLGGHPNENVCRAIAVMTMSHLASGTNGLRGQLADVIGDGKAAAYLVRQYGEIVASNDQGRVERVDETILEHAVFAEWAREFTVKMGKLAESQRVVTHWEFQLPLEKDNANGIRHWLFRRGR